MSEGISGPGLFASFFLRRGAVELRPVPPVDKSIDRCDC